MSIFKKNTSHLDNKTTEGKLGIINNLLNRTSINKTSIEKVVSLEAYGDNDVVLASDVNDAENLGKNIISELSSNNINSNAGYTIAQEQAGIFSMMKSSVPLASSKIKTQSMLMTKVNESTVVMPQKVYGVDFSIVSENYEKERTKVDQATSIQWNISSSRQNDFGEAFFPTSILAPDQLGFSYEVRVVELVKNNFKDFSQKPSAWERQNIIGSERDSKMLENTITELIPVYTTSSTALSQFSNGNVTDMYFSTDILPVTIISNGVNLTTAPLMPNKEINLLEISQTEAIIKSGVMDNTDTIDRAIYLKNIYIKLGDGNVIKYYVKNTPSSAFNETSQGSTSISGLKFSDSTMLLSSNTKTIDSVPLTTSVSGYTVRFTVAIYGEVNHEEGRVSVTPSSFIKVNKITDIQGISMSLTSGIGKTIADNFYDEATNTPKAKIVGYDLDARCTNSNRRQRGPLVTNRLFNYLYIVPLLSPFTSISPPNPVGRDTANDAYNLDSLIAITRNKSGNDGVTALLNALNTIKEKATDIKDLSLSYTNTFGPADNMVTCSYVEDVLDLSTSMNSITSTERSSDLANTIVLKLRHMVFELYYKSNYKVALHTMNISTKPCVIIGTDPILCQYLNIIGDTRLFGDEFNYKVVTTQDSRMKDKIIFSFGVEDAFTSGVPNPLHFGTMAWSPETVINMQITRGGSTSNELSVQPCYLHIPSLPIIGYLEVVGLESAATDKTVISNTPVI